MKGVVASAKNEKAEELFPRNRDVETIDLPLIIEDDLRRPTFTVEAVKRIVAHPGKYQMLYILLAASAMRIGEALALPVTRVVAGSGAR